MPLDDPVTIATVPLSSVMAPPRSVVDILPGAPILGHPRAGPAPGAPRGERGGALSTSSSPRAARNTVGRVHHHGGLGMLTLVRLLVAVFALLLVAACGDDDDLNGAAD